MFLGEKMSGYDLYIFILCLIVFTLLTVLFSAMLHYIIKHTLRAIEHGLEDERITTEYLKQRDTSKCLKAVCTIFMIVVLGLVIVACSTSVYVHFADEEVKGDFQVPKVVMSDSMSFKHQDNLYLEENGLDDQINLFDLIFIRELPDEFELELYDIVVYEYRDNLIIHRIVGIEEPNDEHPGVRHFLLRGDAAKNSDEFPVLYEQMKAIYRGEKIAYVGSFFAFMQSPAGYLCMLLIIFAIVATPIAEKKLWNAKIARLKVIGVIEDDEKKAAEKLAG